MIVKYICKKKQKNKKKKKQFKKILVSCLKAIFKQRILFLCIHNDKVKKKKVTISDSEKNNPN